MKKYNLQCPIRKANPYRRMAKAMATAYTAPNIVNREFEEHGPRKILLTDITYIINGKAPRCYMSTIIDACTKELLSWVLSESLEIDFVLETVKQLIEKHGTDLSTETLIHSDQGSHYTSIKFIQLLKDNELRQSMSRLPLIHIYFPMHLNLKQCLDIPPSRFPPLRTFVILLWRILV